LSSSKTMTTTKSSISSDQKGEPDGGTSVSSEVPPSG